MKEMVSSSRIIEKGDEPEDFLDQFIIDMRKDIEEAEQATRKMIVEEKLLKKRIKTATEKIERRQFQAKEALELGNEDLARRALEDKKLLVVELQQVEELYASTASQVNALREKLKELKAYYQELELKRDALKNKTDTSKLTDTIKTRKDGTGENQSPSLDDIDNELERLKASLKIK